MKDDEGDQPGSAEFVPIKVKLTTGEIKHVILLWIVRHIDIDIEKYDEIMIATLIMPKSLKDDIIICTDDLACGVAQSYSYKLWLPKVISQ